MADRRISEVTFTSDLAEELDQIQVRENYELNEILVVPSPYPYTGDQEEQHLLQVQANENDEGSKYLVTS